MSILQELLALHEAPEVPVELKDVIAAFPKHHGKALEHLWGGRRLVWHGERFFEKDDLGPAYDKAEKAAVEFINDGYNVDVEDIVLDVSTVLDEYDDAEEFRWSANFSDKEGGDRQECYLGYDPKKDKLYIGFDAWISEENFNSDFDDAFMKATGEHFDSDTEGHQEVFDKVWQEYQHQGYSFWGLIFEITNNHGEYSAEEAWPPAPRGFYRGVFKQFKARHPSVIDLRLD